MRRLTRYDAGLIVVSLIWGANYTVTKQALAYVAPVPFAAMRFVLSSVLLVVVAHAVGAIGTVPPGARRRLLLLGVVGHTLNQIAFVGGLARTTATNSALLFALMPVLVAVLGALAGHERPSPRAWAGIALGALGVAIVVGARGVRFSSSTLQGDVITLLAVLLWSGFTVGVRWAAEGVGSIQVTMYTHLGGTPGLVLAALPTADNVGTAVRLPAVAGALLYSALASSVIAAILWTRSLKALGGNRTALYSCVTPIFAVLIAWLALGERPLPAQAIGAALVIAAVLISREARTDAADPGRAAGGPSRAASASD